MKPSQWKQLLQTSLILFVSTLLWGGCGRPETTIDFYNRGVTKQEKGDLNGAIADFSKAIELNPKDAKAYNDRGRAKWNKGDLNDAIADYTKAIELNPKDPDAYTNRGLERIK